MKSLHLYKSRISLILFVVLLALTACGGGGGGGVDTSTNPNPPGTPGPNTASVTLAWDQVVTNSDESPCTDLAGYRIYYGTSSGITKSNSQMVDVGNVLTGEIGNLTIGKTYYFRMSAYDIHNNESDISSEELAVSI